MTDDLALEARQRLPDALRALLADWPREAWEADQNFSELIRFWLDRHLMFRRLHGLLDVESRAFLDGDREARAFAGRLNQLGGMLLNELHGHHMVEDQHYFPKLRRLDGRLETGFDILDRDHHAIDPMLHALAGDANAVLGALDRPAAARDAAGRLVAALERFGGFLDRHLVDEEELVVPVLLAHPEAGLQ
jgi:iron-sulfur cluster repair protein YtfE (RIC family)